MYNANDAFATHFAMLLSATRAHANSNDFATRVAARDQMAFAERKIASAKRHHTFDLQTATQMSMQLKSRAA